LTVLQEDVVMSDDSSFPPGKSLEGKQFLPKDSQELQEVIGLAFDYRGDVTFRLKSNESIAGFVFDRNERVPQPYLRMYVENLSDPQTVTYENIEEVFFSGEDTAFGRSWEDWAKKWKGLHRNNPKEDRST
jgi:hypothetical protein